MAFVAAGFGLARHNLMYNDFILLGPEIRPCGYQGRFRHRHRTVHNRG